MRVAPLIELVVGIAHGVRLAAAEHHLEIDRPEAVILIAMDPARRARDAFPWAQPRGQALAALVLDEDVEKALQHEEAFLDLMGMGRIALARLDIHDREREIARRDDARVAVLAGAAGADEAMLGALEAFDLGALEGRPVRLLLAEAADEFLHDVLDRHADELGRPRMTCNAHEDLLCGLGCRGRIYAFVDRAVNKSVISLHSPTPIPAGATAAARAARPRGWRAHWRPHWPSRRRPR